MRQGTISVTFVQLILVFVAATVFVACNRDTSTTPLADMSRAGRDLSQPASDMATDATNDLAQTPVTIDLVTPASPTAGYLITVGGSGFSVPYDSNMVTIGGVAANLENAKSNSSTQLQVMVPTIPGIDVSGSEVVLRVENASGAAASIAMTVRATAVIDSGTIGITYTGIDDASGTPLAPGATLT